MDKRIASLHVMETDLKEYLTKYYPKIDPLKFMQGLKSKSITHRNILVDDEFSEKKASNLTSASRNDADIMARYIFLHRKRLRHMGITQIKPNSRDWVMLKKITKQANNFCKTFMLSKELGYNKYLQVGLEKTQKFSLLKLYSLEEAIHITYQALQELSEDKHPGVTRTLHDYYQYRIADKTGIPTNYLKNYEKYVCFARAAVEVVSQKVTPEDYLDAQFKGFDWRNDYPDPSQLYGEKAIQRLAKFLYNRKSTPQNSNRPTKISLSGILKNTDDDTDNS